MKIKLTELIEYKEIELQKITVNEVTFGLRQIGSGENLVFIHGFPTHGYTWRKVLPSLSKKFKCHILDLPGLGDSDWSGSANFNIAVQASNINVLLKKIGVEKYNIIAHDSGGTIARVLAMDQVKNVKNLILINTEIPNHRPPFIELYQKVSRLPFSSFYFRKKLAQKRFVKSSMGFKQAYTDRAMLDDENNLGPYLQPLIKSRKKVKGALKFLRGIDWEIIDAFEQTHSKIKASVLLIWGENDKTFPIKLGLEMVNQFSSTCEFKAIKNASLLPHEEQPVKLVNEIFKFFNKEYT